MLLASFLVPYTVSSLNVALPAISESFSIDAVTLGGVTSAYLITAAIFIVPIGKLADTYGRKQFFILGNVLFAIGSLLAAVSWSGSVIIAARIHPGARRDNGLLDLDRHRDRGLPAR